MRILSCCRPRCSRSCVSCTSRCRDNARSRGRARAPRPRDNATLRDLVKVADYPYYARSFMKGKTMRALVVLALWSATSIAADDFTLNAQEYFERPGINVMYGQDYYPEGHQGGLSVIMHDERIASNGDVRLEPSPGQWSPIPKPGKREVTAATREIRVSLAFPDPERDRKGFNPIVYPDLKLDYHVRARADGESIL